MNTNSIMYSAAIYSYGFFTIQPPKEPRKIRKNIETEIQPVKPVNETSSPRDCTKRTMDTAKFVFAQTPCFNS
ncbi:MAG: hypothetical protein Q7R52_03910 [archaeon]|nr:hypothetical protein [archaeon]